VTVSLSEWLHRECRGEWEDLHAHPFLRELAAGTLPLEVFRFYLEQNLRYLPEYARCIAVGAAKSRDEEQLGWFEEALTNIVRNELPLNRSLLERVIDLGAEDRRGDVTMALANRAYTGFLHTVAWGGDTLEILTAILPCAWSYGEIAERLQAEIVPHPVYSDWVGFFATAEYAELVETMRGRLDRLGADATPATRAHLRDVFAEGSRLELGFWEMAYGQQQWPDSGIVAATAPPGTSG
jgi:thiaminase/transcriptional activator TenA